MSDRLKPKIPWCIHCSKPQDQHANGIKCLYQSTSFEAVICARCGHFIPSDEPSIWEAKDGGEYRPYHTKGNCGGSK